MSSEVCDRLTRLEMSEKRVLEKLDDQNKKQLKLYDLLEALTEKQREIFGIIQAVKWSALGSFIMLFMQNFGVLDVLKTIFLH
ncbi:MAG: hypothetical protein M0R47_17075 [Methylobacter sp.]|uniref:hypothetical protein n=1 Tax=Methylobacter sp. TaxID=2051955 RepID=UPI0025D1DC97|nr:hypothetical protein [Methylobacter sp.]MCK9622237.1 hypothetical protein [Methylobacter sp.]